eukprot:3321075-Ditylum_brightwellii.AAC.1
MDHAITMMKHKNISGVFADATRSNMETEHSSMIEDLMNALPGNVIKMSNFLCQRDSYRYDKETNTMVPHNDNHWRLAYSDGSYLENVHDGPTNQPEGESLIASIQMAREALMK